MIIRFGVPARLKTRISRAVGVTVVSSVYNFGLGFTTLTRLN